MKAIASVTVAFLPAATVAAIFGCQFFSFDGTTEKLQVSSDFWIFWVLTLPFCVFVFLLYYWLCYLRGMNGRSGGTLSKIKHGPS